MGSTIIESGERITTNNKRIVFVQGAYNCGAVIIWREIETAVMHPGEAADNATGAGGEDHIVLMTDKSLNPLGIVEWDPAQVAGISTDYAVADEVPVIPFHMNPGAILQSIHLTDPASNIEPNQGLTSSSAVAGAFIDYVECDVVVEDGGKFCFGNTAAGVNGAAGTMLYTRVYMRSPYYVADPGAGVHPIVGYIWK